MWWIKAAIQQYILGSWSLVKMGTTANQKKLFFNLRKAKSRIYGVPFLLKCVRRAFISVFQLLK
jgi:DNA-directed RNA polymerase sigma subunit (sigma70/sigma32)